MRNNRKLHEPCSDTKSERNARGLSLQGKKAPSVDRREFIRSMGRASALFGLGAFAFLMFDRGRRRRHLPDQSCVNRGVCEGCRAIDSCGLPQALSRKSKRGKINECSSVP